MPLTASLAIRVHLLVIAADRRILDIKLITCVILQVLATRCRMATIIATTPCEVFRLSKKDYDQVLSELPEEARSSSLDKVMTKYWQLVCNEGKGRILVDFSVYMKLHLRVAKALTENAEEFDVDEMQLSCREDWNEDCARYGLKAASAELDQELYINAMYQLVNLWAEEKNISYSTFLEKLFDCIVRDTTLNRIRFVARDVAAAQTMI